jgi:hypothetical protein
MRLIALVAGALAICLVAAGCGGGDSSTASITKAEFITQADAACKKGEKQIETDFAAYIKEHKDVKNPSEDDYTELVETILVPNATQEVDDIRALGVPSGDDEQVESMLTAFEGAIQTAEDDPQAVIKDTEKVFSESSKLAKEYGLKVCGSR